MNYTKAADKAREQMIIRLRPLFASVGIRIPALTTEQKRKFMTAVSDAAYAARQCEQAWEITRNTRKDFRELGIDALPVIAVRADEIVKIINEELLAASEGIKCEKSYNDRQHG